MNKLASALLFGSTAVICLIVVAVLLILAWWCHDIGAWWTFWMEPILIWWAWQFSGWCWSGAASFWDMVRE